MDIFSASGFFFLICSNGQLITTLMKFLDDSAVGGIKFTSMMSGGATDGFTHLSQMSFPIINN